MSVGRRLLFSIAAWLVLGPAAQASAPAVVVSVAPVHSLVAAVMEGVATPRLLLRGAQSPHRHALRPSEVSALHGARLVVWVGPGLESFLPRVLATLGPEVRVLELAQVEGLRRLAPRRGGLWISPEEGHAEVDDDHGAVDMHLWLDAGNAERWVAAIAADLAAIDPDNAAVYEANRTRTTQRLRALDADLRGRLAPVREERYVVFHDAYGYLETRYGLSPLGSVSVGDGRAPGARRLRELRQLLLDRGARCAFAEPQFDSGLLRNLLDGTGVRSGRLDPLGAALDPGPEQYFRLMRALADSLLDCLGG